MFKKARLYSLLAVIVVSTAVGLFGMSQAAQAQTTECPSDKDCITWKGTNKTNGYYDYLEYKGETYDLKGSGATYSLDKDFKASPCGDAPLVYQHNAVGGGYHIICFKSGSSDATLVYFPNAWITNAALCNNENIDCGDNMGTFEFLPDGMATEYNIIVAGEAIDLGNAEEEHENDEDALNDDDDDEGEQVPTASRCQIKGIGWLLCPVILFLAEVTDNSYNILNHTFLKLEPIVLPGAESNENSMRLYTSWRAMRDFANVVFIAGFLIIVFSQITNIGVSNYGIKRLLPKIIIAAILVNVSYYLCAIAVDLSNILGNSLRGVLMSVGTESSGAGPLSFTISPDGMSGEGYGITDWQTLANVVMGMAGGALAAAGVGIAVYAFLPVFLPLVLSAAIAVLTVVIALTIRQALVVILIVVSPLAFVALLLPNTESYFQKWKSLFTAMLLVYPIISVIFGASALAAKILMATNDFPTQLVGAGVSTIPLFLTPIVMKASGGLLNRWVGLVNNPNRGPIDGMRKGLEGKAKRWEDTRKINSLNSSSQRSKRDRLYGGFRYRRSAKETAINAGTAAEASREANQFIAKEIKENDGNNKLARSVAGSNNPAALERAVANATYTVEKAEIEEVKAAGVTISGANFPELAAIVNNATSSPAKIAAALDRMITISDPEDYEGYVNHYGSRTEESEGIVRSTMKESLSKNGPQFLKASDLDNIGNGQLGKEKVDKKTGLGTGEYHASGLADIAKANPEVLSQAKMAADSIGNLKYAFDNASPEGHNILIKTAQDLINNPTLSGQIKHNKEQIYKIAGSAPKTLPPIYGPPIPPSPPTYGPPPPSSRPDDV